MKKKLSAIFIILSVICFVSCCTPYSFASNHTHTGDVKVKSVKEHNGYVVIKWNKSSKCKGYCVHLQCGSKTLYAKCYGKTIKTARIKLTKTLEKKLDKCGNWSAKVYCSDRGPSGANGGRGG